MARGIGLRPDVQDDFGPKPRTTGIAVRLHLGVGQPVDEEADKLGVRRHELVETLIARYLPDFLNLEGLSDEDRTAYIREVTRKPDKVLDDYSRSKSDPDVMDADALDRHYLRIAYGERNRAD